MMETREKNAKKNRGWKATLAMLLSVAVFCMMPLGGGSTAMASEPDDSSESGSVAAQTSSQPIEENTSSLPEEDASALPEEAVGPCELCGEAGCDGSCAGTEEEKEEAPEIPVCGCEEECAGGEECACAACEEMMAADDGSHEMHCCCGEVMASLRSAPTGAVLEFDIANGDVAITSTGVTQGIPTPFDPATQYVKITGSAADKKITVANNNGEAVQVVLSGVHLTNAAGICLEKSGNSALNLMLEGDNTLAATDTSLGTIYPAVKVAEGILNVSSVDDTPAHSLAVSSGNAAGIDTTNGAMTTFSSGTIVAAGGEDAAGIGGSTGRMDRLPGGAIDHQVGFAGGNITIGGSAHVTATGGPGGAGIGGGLANPDGNNILITDDAVVTANAGNGAKKRNASVTESDAAGIGGGGSNGTFEHGGAGGTITINGNAVVNATGNGGGSGVGSGFAGTNHGQAGPVITIAGSATVTATGSAGRSRGGAGIGGGGSSSCGTVRIAENATVTAVGGNASPSGAAGTGGGAGIGGGGGNGGRVEITGGTVYAKGGDSLAAYTAGHSGSGIGSGGGSINAAMHGPTNSVIVITGGNITAVGGSGDWSHYASPGIGKASNFAFTTTLTLGPGAAVRAYSENNLAIAVDGNAYTGGAILQHHYFAKGYLPNNGVAATTALGIAATGGTTANLTIPAGYYRAFAYTAGTGNYTHVTTEAVARDIVLKSNNAFAIPSNAANTSTSTEVVLKAPQFTLIYHINGGQTGGGPLTLPETHEAGSVTLKAAPANVYATWKAPLGYAFDGWSTTQDGGNKVSGSYNLTGDVTLYAQWKLASPPTGAWYKVTYDGNGATAASMPPAEDVEQGTVYTVNNQLPVRAGYVFTGWKSDNDNGTYYSGMQFVMPGKDVKLTAQWIDETDAGSFQVTYAAGAASGVTGLPASDASVRQGDNYVVKSGVPVRGGYVFTHWDHSAYPGAYVGGQAFTMPARNVTLTAQWQPAGATPPPTYSVTYLPGAESGVSGMPTPAKISGLAAGDVHAVSGDVPVRSGYTFKGWKQDGIGKAYFGGDTLSMPARNVELVALWDAVPTYILRFDTQGGGANPADQVLPAGAKTTKPDEIPQKTGRIFKGWYTQPAGGNLWDFDSDTMPAENTTLYAQYVNAEYRVTFKHAGAPIGDRTILVEYGSLVPQPANPAWIGYAFVEWRGENGQAWNFGVNTMPAADIVLTAQWNAAVYTVRFVDHDGTLLKAQQVNWGGSATPPATPTWQGFVFVNWDGNYQNVTKDETVVATYTPATASAPVSGVSSTAASVASSSAPVSSSASGGGPASAPSAPSAPSSAPLPASGRGTVAPPSAVVVSSSDEYADTEAISNTGTVPLGGLTKAGAWSLLNLILSVIALFCSVYLIVAGFRRRKERVVVHGEEYEQKSDKTHFGLLRVISILAGLVMLVLFLVLENLRNPVVWIDRWTMLFGVVFLIQLVFNLLQFAKNKNQETDEENTRETAG